MEIVHVANGDYDRYEELLLQRDQLEKEAFGYEQAFIREFGELTVEAFRVKVDCISLKKAIAFCLIARNRGEKPDPAALREYLERQMAAYKKQLGDMIDEHDAAKKGEPISALEVIEIKKIYRRVAKLLHPDISPLTKEHPELAELFRRTIIAYHCNDLKELRDTEALIDKVLRDNGVGGFSVVIPDVAQRILDLESEIERILTTEPYLYGELLADAFRAQAKKDALTKEIAEYKEYCGQLAEQLRTLKGEGKNG